MTWCRKVSTLLTQNAWDCKRAKKGRVCTASDYPLSERHPVCQDRQRRRASTAMCIAFTSQTVGGTKPQSNPEEGCTMKKLIVILLTGWAFILSCHVQNVAADEEGHRGIPLRNLAGTYADMIHAAIFV